MATAFDLVTIDAPRPDVLAAFWRTALGLVELEREDGDRWIVIGHASGDRVLGIQRGTARPGGVHLDLACSPEEFDDEVARLLAAGAARTRPDRSETYGLIANLVDPCGYAFDLCAYVP
jgi:predicted enzyme related to lactoylglutathione lyase